MGKYVGLRTYQHHCNNGVAEDSVLPGWCHVTGWMLTDVSR